MSFRDRLEADLTNVFINLDEFGEVREISQGPSYSALSLPCVLTRDEFQKPVQGDARFMDTFQRGWRLFVKKIDMPFRPVRDSEITIDGDYYLVQECLENEGLYQINLLRNEA